MVENSVGYRFSPTGEELVNDYLKNKNLGKSWLVDDTISEISICSYKPMLLPSLSKIKSNDLVWYFFSLKEYSTVKKTTMKRTTGSGFWKPTGKDRIIKDNRGSKIGIKKTLVYHEGKVSNGVRTPWVMHEYHIIYLPPNLTTYVLCQVKYKGEDGDILYGGNDSMVSHSDSVRVMNTVPEVDQPVEDGLYLSDLSNPLNLQEDLRPLDASSPSLLQQIPEVQVKQPAQDGLFMDELIIPVNVEEDLVLLDPFDPITFLRDNNLNLQQQTPDGEDYYNEYLGYNEGNYEALIADQESILQENRDLYRPEDAFSSIIVDCNSDSDGSAEPISATVNHNSSFSLSILDDHYPQLPIF